MTETEWQRLVLLALNAPGTGIYVYRVQAGKVRTRGGFLQLAPEGVADLVGFRADGKHLEVECKTAAGKLREAQERHRELVQRMGGVYVVARAPKLPVDVTKTLAQVVEEVRR